MKILGCIPLLLVVTTPLATRSRAFAVYEQRTLHGFTVHVERSLLAEQSETGDAALELLGVKLYDVARAVPPKALTALRKVPIWLSYEDSVAPCACYHPSAEWLSQNGHDPAKAGGVEIANAQRFLDWTKDQPWMVMHELAHAYHHAVLSYENEDVAAAHRRAVASERYASVLHYDGKKVRAYALGDAKEFFAEASEAYFGTNDFYPFVRAELRAHDAETFELLERLWGD